MRTRVLPLLALAVFATACGGGDSGTSPTPQPQPVASVSVQPSALSLTAGQTGNLTAQARDASGNSLSGRTITWSTSDATIATVSTQGVVTGVAPGTATITATSEGKSDSSTITVTPTPVASVTVAPATLGLTVGQTGSVTATTRDASGNTLDGRAITWASSASVTARVSAEGVVTALAPGTATITATSEGKSGSAMITVTPIPVALVTVAPATLGLIVSQTGTLTATVKDASGNTLNDRTLTWASSALGTATVSTQGVVTGVAPGSATITATSEGKSGGAAITVAFGVANQLVLTTGAAGAMNGMAFKTQPVVAVRDAYGNTLPTDNTTVVTMTTGGGATVLGTAAKTAAGGVATFNSVGIRGTVGVSYSLTFAATGLTPAAQTITVTPLIFGSGTKIVGVDVLAGVYRSNNLSTVSCYWERLSGFGGTSGEIIANYFGRGPAVVEVSATDKGFSSSGCAQWVQVSGPITTSPAAPFGVGVFVVGMDIAPGLWRSNNDSGTSCYWERLRGFGGTSAETIANDIGGGPAVVEVSTTDKGFSSSGCAQWVQVVGPITTSPTAQFGEGTYIVGTDISPGTWQSNGTGTGCYWERLSGFGGTSAETIANFFGSAPAVVTIGSTDRGFISRRCGTWSKIG